MTGRLHAYARTAAMLAAIIAAVSAVGSFGAQRALAATIYANSSTGNDTTGTGSSASPYQTFTKAYGSASSGDTLNLTGTFIWTNAGETTSATTGFTIGKNITIVGQGADKTAIEAATASTSATRRVFTVSSGVTAIIQGVEMRNGNVSSYYGGGIQNNGTLSVIADEIDDNISGEGGAGIDNLDLLTVASSTVDHNLCNGSTGMGCGILSDYYIVSGGYTTITDSTIAYNTIDATTGYYSGAGIHFRKGSGAITNSTIAYNESCESALGMDDTAAVLTMKNTIVADNKYHYGSFCSSGNAVDFAFRQSGYGNVVDNGDNIVGYSSLYTWSAAGDWTDQSRNGTFVLQTVGTTGPVDLATALALNGTNDGVPTLSISTGSVAINNGGTGANGATSTVPALDERGASRSGSTDIGAYEYGGALTDTSPPSVSLLAPASGEATSSSVTLSASASDNVAVAGVTFYADGAAQGSEVTSAPYAYSWNASATTTGWHTAFAVARDTSNNYATSSAVSFTVDSTVAAISDVSVATTSSSATIAWTTSTTTSSKVSFGITSSYSSTTSETDLSPRVTSHSVLLSGLAPCAEYHYQIYGKDGMTNSTTSPDETFFTSGCVGSASISSTTASSIATSSGGTLSSGGLTLTAPSAFTTTSSALVFQADQLDGTAFFATAGAPSGETRAGSTVFHLSAFSDATTTVSAFAKALTISLAYSTADVSGLDASTLKIYRYDSGTWTPLDACSVDTGAMKVTCTTTGFSDFAIFGQAAASSSSSSSGTAAAASPGGGSVGEQYQNLLAMGFVSQAEALRQEYPTELVTAEAIPAADPAQTAAPSGSSSANPIAFSRALEEGMNGPDIRSLQEYLNAHGFALASAGAGSPGHETELFGPLTRNAVAAFQQRYQIAYPGDSGYGVVGPNTRAAMMVLQGLGK